MRNKRRAKVSRQFRKKRAKPNLLPVVLILCLAVGCGYATANYVVEPVVNYVPQMNEDETEQTEQDNDTDDGEADKSSAEQDGVVEDEVSVEETGNISGYALQFGCYSSKASAENAMSSLDVSDLQILKQDSMYKIVGEVFETKDEARTALQELTDPSQAFVTTIYE